MEKGYIESGALLTPTGGLPLSEMDRGLEERQGGQEEKREGEILMGCKINEST